MKGYKLVFQKVYDNIHVGHLVYLLLPRYCPYLGMATMCRYVKNVDVSCRYIFTIDVTNRSEVEFHVYYYPAK